MKGQLTVDGITATYEWWELDHHDIEETLKGKLNLIAVEKITEWIKSGFTHGELPAQSYAYYDAMYTGYWEIKK